MVNAVALALTANHKANLLTVPFALVKAHG